METAYPYIYTYDKYYTNLSKPICTNTTGFVKIANATIDIKYYTGLTIETLQGYLSTVGPITVAVSANNANFLYAGPTGLINSCPPADPIDHAVLLVGYNTTHWFIKNSWGTNWGHNGYGYILKTNDCQLKATANVMTVTPTTTPTPSPTPVVTDTITYTISMKDSKSNGWNGTVLAFKQNNAIVATFGASFTSGASATQTVTIKNNI